MTHSIHKTLTLLELAKQLNRKNIWLHVYPDFIQFICSFKVLTLPSKFNQFHKGWRKVQLLISCCWLFNLLAWPANSGHNPSSRLQILLEEESSASSRIFPVEILEWLLKLSTASIMMNAEYDCTCQWNLEQHNLDERTTSCLLGR